MNPVVAQLTSGTVEERVESARLLCRAPDPEAFDALVAALYEQSGMLIREAAAALVALGGSAAREELRRAATEWVAYQPVRLEDGTVLRGRTHVGERRGSALALAFARCHGDAELCAMLDDRDELWRWPAACVLGERRAAGATAALEQAAGNDPDEVVRSAAVGALQDIRQGAGRTIGCSRPGPLTALACLMALGGPGC